MRRSSRPLGSLRKRTHYRRLERTVGLCWIFLILPLWFLAPHVYNDVREKTVRAVESRAGRLAERVDQELGSLSHKMHPPLAPYEDPEKLADLWSAVRRSIDSSLWSLATITVSRGNTPLIRSRPDAIPRLTRLFSLEVEGGGEAVLATRALTDPFSEFSLTITAPLFPFARDAYLALIDALILVVALLVGGAAIYRLGLGHLSLLEQKDAFIAGVSHELKVPLATIQLYSEMLEQGWHCRSEDRGRYFDFIRQQSDRLARMVENVLAIARGGEYAKSKFAAAEEFSPAELRRTVERLLQEFCRPHGFHVTAEQEPHLLFDAAEGTVKVQRDWLSQIVFNIADNSIKFTPNEARREVCVSFSLDNRRGRVVLVFRDFGQGFDPKMTNRLFEPFFQGARCVRGSGLGLAVTRDLVTALGGFIRARCASPGSEFIVELPLARKPPQHKPRHFQQSAA